MKKKYRLHYYGFTLVELMVVVAILGVLSVLVMIRFGNLKKKAQEASTKGNLSILRSCVIIYYAKNETQYPASLTAGLITENMDRLPITTLYGHPDRNGEITAVDDSNSIAGWVYPSISSTDNGKVWVNCTHTDIVGEVISSW